MEQVPRAGLVLSPGDPECRHRPGVQNTDAKPPPEEKLRVHILNRKKQASASRKITGPGPSMEQQQPGRAGAGAGGTQPLSQYESVAEVPTLIARHTQDFWDCDLVSYRLSACLALALPRSLFSLWKYQGHTSFDPPVTPSESKPAMVAPPVAQHSGG